MSWQGSLLSVCHFNHTQTPQIKFYMALSKLGLGKDTTESDQWLPATIITWL